MQERACVIVNPAAGRGRGAKMLPSISGAFANEGIADVKATLAKGDEARLATEAIANGCTTIVIVGGDGTLSNVANVILHSGRDVRLAVMPAGTGNDFAKLLGTSKVDVAALARLCRTSEAQRVDAGKVEDVYFVNCCGFGFDVAVLEGIARNSRLRGNSVYVYTALMELFGYPGVNIGVSSQASTRASELHLLLAIANASYFGGTFEIAPGAIATDGMLDAVSILNVAPWKRIGVLAAAIRGKHERYRECVRERASTFTVSFAVPPTYEADGELHHAQTPTVTVSSCPGALRVVAAHRL